MGANTSRVTKILVSNTLAANTGNTLATMVNDDVVLFDRTMTELADTATLANNANADTIYIGLGTGLAGSRETEMSLPIQPRNIRKVKVNPYVAPVQHSIFIPAASFVVANSSEYTLSVEYQDNNRVMHEHGDRNFFYYKSDATATITEITAGLAAKINAVKFNKQVTAVGDVNGLTITGIAVTPNSINQYQFRYFNIFLKQGFVTGLDKAAVMTATSGLQGEGHGEIVKNMEQDTKKVQRIAWPIPVETNRATNAGKYNLVTIEHTNAHMGDLHGTYHAPMTTVVAFLTTDGTQSAKQVAFIEKLTSIAESAGVYVSDVVPA